jgi:hypothetical protein
MFISNAALDCCHPTGMRPVTLLTKLSAVAACAAFSLAQIPTNPILGPCGRPVALEKVKTSMPTCGCSAAARTNQQQERQETQRGSKKETALRREDELETI